MSDIQKKKIIFCGAKTYPAGIGGIETHLFYLVPEIAKAGFDAHVITGKEERGQPDYEMVNGVHIHRVFSLKVPVLRKLSMSLGIHEIVEKINPDIIHAHDTVTSYAAVKHFGNRCRVVCTAHGVNHLRPDWKFPVKNYLKVMEHQIYKNAAAVIAVDTRSEKMIKEISGRKEGIYYIPNGIETAVFENAQRKRDGFFRDDKVHILFAGRLIESKGVFFLLESYLALPEDTRKKAVLHYVGDGPLLLKLKEEAGKYTDIYIHGRVEDIIPYYKSADIFVLPSDFEGFPFTILEAMAARLACISTDVSDLKMRFSEKEILFVNRRNNKMLTEALALLILSPNRRTEMGKNAFAKVNKEYSWRNIVEKTLEVYSTLKFKNQSSLMQDVLCY